MELLNTKEGIPALLASIAVIMSLHLIFKMGEFVWEIIKKKNEVSEKSIENLNEAIQANTKAVQHLEMKIQDIEKNLSEIPKFKLDLRRLFTAIKFMSGENWKEVRSVIMDEEDLSS